MAVPNTFQTATSAIPLANLDANFTYYDNAFSISGTATTFTGTATATKLIPTGSSATGNGLYLPAANSVGISTNGTNAVYINSSQNVGIGVTSVATNFRTQFLGTAGSNTSAASSGTTQSASAVLRLQAGGGFTATLDIGQGGGTGSWLQSCDTGNLATTYPLLLNPVGGNVGIGVTSVTGKFQVKAATNQSLYIGASTTIANSVVIGGLNDAASANIPLEFRYGTTAAFINSGTEAMRIDSSGNLLVGTTSNAGAAKLLVSNAGAEGIEFFPAQSSNLANTQYYNRSGAAYVVNLQNAADHRWQTAGTERMRIDTSGNLLVGATSALTVGKVSVGFNGTNNNGIVLSDTVPASGVNYALFQITGTTIGSIARVAATSAVVYNTTSDYRLKTVTGSVTGQGARIDALKPVDYQWKKDGQAARGFLAHEFQEVYANSVTGTKDAVDADGNPKYQAMQAATSEVIADLVAEIQSLRKRLTALEST